MAVTSRGAARFVARGRGGRAVVCEGFCVGRWFMPSPLGTGSRRSPPRTPGATRLGCWLLWLRGVEGIVPDRWDLLGAGIAVAGALVVLLGPRS